VGPLAPADRERMDVLIGGAAAQREARHG
jgi:hypothetical protein